MQIASLKFSISAQVTNRTWWTKSPAQNTPFSILLKKMRSGTKKMRWPAICLEFNQKYKARFNEGVFDPLTKKNRKNKQYASNDKLETVQSLDQKKKTVQTKINQFLYFSVSYYLQRTLVATLVGNQQ